MRLSDRSGSHMPLFWRVILANAAILLAGILVLVLTPLHVSKHKTVDEIIVLFGGLALMIVANWLTLRPLFRPLERLAGRMEEADVLRGGQRVPLDSSGEVGALEQSFNTMMERLETERREAGARTLSAQEAERQRIARGLHDEVGQTMTGVLLLLKRVAQDATPEQRAALSEAQAAVKVSLEDVRRTAQELRPEILDHLGLPSALTNLARTFSDRTGIPVQRQLASQLPKLDPKVDDAARTVLAALGLCAAALTAESGLDLRSRCLLWPVAPLSWELLGKPGHRQEGLTLEADEAITLLKESVAAAKELGLPWREEPLRLVPSDDLVKLVVKSQQLSLAQGGEGGQ